MERNKNDYAVCVKCGREFHALIGINGKCEVCQKEEKIGVWTEAAVTSGIITAEIKTKIKENDEFLKDLQNGFVKNTIAVINNNALNAIKAYQWNREMTLALKLLSDMSISTNEKISHLKSLKQITLAKTVSDYKPEYSQAILFTMFGVADEIGNIIDRLLEQIEVENNAQKISEENSENFASKL